MATRVSAPESGTFDCGQCGTASYWYYWGPYIPGSSAHLHGEQIQLQLLLHDVLVPEATLRPQIRIGVDQRLGILIVARQLEKPPVSVAAAIIVLEIATELAKLTPASSTPATVGMRTAPGVTCVHVGFSVG